MRKKKKDEPDERGPTSLFLFTPTSPVRKMMTWLVNWPPFDWVIIITIMANCVVMAMDDKLSNNDKSIMSIKLVSWNTHSKKWHHDGKSDIEIEIWTKFGCFYVTATTQLFPDSSCFSSCSETIQNRHKPD